MPTTLVTIITPSLNGGEYFEQTLRSVLSQEGDFQLQWLVIDGGSTDRTVRLLESAGDKRLQWISEPDGGQTAAINKGLALARGDIVAWLNCDDVYVPGALAKMVGAFEGNPLARWVVGRCDIIDKSGASSRQKITEYKDRRLRRFSFKALLRMNVISQPAVFWRREFGAEVGGLDESLHYTMDYDLWLRMTRRCQPMILDEVLARFRVHGTSKSRGGHREQFEEGYRVACRYVGADVWSRCAHRWNVEKIVWGYRAMRWMGR